MEAPSVGAASRRHRRGARRVSAAAARRTLGGLLLAVGAAARCAWRGAGGLAYVPGNPQLALPPRTASIFGRRSGLLQLGSAGLVGAGGVPLAWADAAQEFKSSWVAKEGTSFLTSFSEESYGAMRDDARRTPAFIKAIRERVSAQPGLTMLDIGTGPFALFALVAARAGAKKVYAIEANPEAVARARAFVEKATDIPPGTIEVIEGFTTALQLPEKVDLVCAEIIGAIASEENCIATIRDAQTRFLKEPNNPESYIPVGAQTFAAPVTYALHPVLAPPRFEKLKGMPLRLNCRDETLQLLAEPQMIEDIQFSSPSLPAPGAWKQNPWTFKVTSERLEANNKKYFNALVKEPMKEDEAAPIAKETAYSFSGIAFWPKLILNTAGTIVVESRGPNGEHQKSHWQTLMSLVTPIPVPIKAGDSIVLTEQVDLQRDILSPGKYDLNVKLLSV
mmetsp:Transcript_91405/g.295685  ORF Transcript_91405/g.295685 Transcript_91405/m.295685 type:complete len:449 (+) Transcript_91405:64-1410(+)